MTKHLNDWRPDTCTCVIEFFFDDEIDAIMRTHTWESTKKTCPVHILITDGVSLYATILEENQRKNSALAIIGTLSTVDREELQGAHSWSFDDSTPRVLTLSFKNKLPAQSLKGLGDAVDLQFGPDTVIIKR